jgi:hypothetical protein
LLILFSFRDNGWRAVFKVYFDRDYRYHKYRLATSRMPFAWVSSTLTLMACTMFSFNMGKYNALQFISMDALFDNPYDLLNTEYYDQFASAEFYAPSYVQMEVIDTLTQKYVNYYRQMHMNPNLTPSKHNGTERRS